MPSPRRILEVRVDSPSAASAAALGGEQRHVDGERTGPEVSCQGVCTAKYVPACVHGNGVGTVLTTSSVH